jgi:hypothetical protein
VKSPTHGTGLVNGMLAGQYDHLRSELVVMTGLFVLRKSIAIEIPSSTVGMSMHAERRRWTSQKTNEEEEEGEEGGEEGDRNERLFVELAVCVLR